MKMIADHPHPLRKLYFNWKQLNNTFNTTGYTCSAEPLF